MARGSRASKGRGPTRRERREAQARQRAERADRPAAERPAEKLSKRKQRAAANIARRTEQHPVSPVRRPWYRDSRRRLFSGAVVLLAGLCTLVIGVGWWLAVRPPAWWATIDPASPRIVSTSRAVENWAVSTMTRARPASEPWAITISEQDANAWLAVRLPMWVTSERGEWPEGIHSVRARFMEDRIVIGADIREPGSDTARVVAAALRLRIDGEGAASVAIDWTQINRLKLPGSLGVNRLSEWIEQAGEDDRVAERIASLVRGDLRSDSLGWKLEDGRRVTVHAIRVEEGQVHLTCSTASAR